LHRNWSQYRVEKVVFAPKRMTKYQLETRTNETYKELYTLKSIIRRSFSLPVRNIASLFALNIVARKFVYNGSWLNAG